MKIKLYEDGNRSKDLLPLDKGGGEMVKSLDSFGWELILVVTNSHDECLCVAFMACTHPPFSN